jgi:hypothetical protein
MDFFNRYLGILKKVWVVLSSVEVMTSQNGKYKLMQRKFLSLVMAPMETGSGNFDSMAN